MLFCSWLMNRGEVNSVFQAKSEILTKTLISGQSQSQLFSVSFNQIPSYYHNFSDADVAALNGRPKAASDFKASSGTTVSAGQLLEFGADLGYNSSSCALGYWPTGPVCPKVLSASTQFSLFPAQETSSGECRIFPFTAGSRVGIVWTCLVPVCMFLCMYVWPLFWQAGAMLRWAAQWAGW